MHWGVFALSNIDLRKSLDKFVVRKELTKLKLDSI